MTDGHKSELENRLSDCIRMAKTEAARRCQAATGPEGDARHFCQRAAAILQDIQAEVLADPIWCARAYKVAATLAPHSTQRCRLCYILDTK